MSRMGTATRIIILLLSWPCARAIEDEKPPSEEVIDQLATASENQPVAHDEPKDPPTTVESSEGSTTLNPINVAEMHYENANGFVPMRSIDYGGSESPDAEETSAANEDNETGANEEVSQTAEKIEDDPAYSTEARMFLNLAGPSADRRSFDTQDAQSEFEILKVNKETPAVANYHTFYEKVENNLGRSRGGSQVGYEEETGGGRTSAQNKRTKDRIKQIEKYFTNYQMNEDRKNAEPYEQFYNNYQSGQSRSPNRQKDIFEPAKVQDFGEQSAASNYDVYSESPQHHKTPGSLKSNSYDSGMTSSRPNYPATGPKNRFEKPVIVVEPSDFRLDIKYGTQQVSAKSSSVDNHRSQKHRKTSPEMESSSHYDDDSRVNREDRYGPSYERSEDLGDYSGEDEYLEITEKPRRIHKSRRRPHSTESSRRLPKEHRSHVHDDLEPEDPRKGASSGRPKSHRPRAKPSYWIEDEQGPGSDENSEEVIEKPSALSKAEDKRPKQGSKSKGVPTWSQVGPNIEVSHSNGFEIGQIDKPKLLVPVNLNLLPLGNFDHSAAIGNSQGFDFTNVPNLVTATPLVSSPTPILSTSHTLANNAHGNSPNPTKNQHNSVHNNYGLSTPAPDIIVGQNSYHSPVQALLLPQMNVNTKLSPHMRTHYSPSTVSPVYAVTHSINNNLQNMGPTMPSVPMQNYQSTVSPRPANQVHQNAQHFAVNPVTAPPPLLLPQPTLQSIPLLHTPYNGHSNYNILVNPNGLHGQNVIQNANGPSGAGQNSASSTTTPQPNTISSINYKTAETQVRKNVATNSNGQYVTTAIFSVGNQGPSSTGSENKYYLPTSNNNNNNFYNGNQNNQQVIRPQNQENYYQIYRDDQNANGKLKTYVQTAQMVPAILHHPNGVPAANLNNEHHTSFGGQLQGQPSVLTPNVVLQAPRAQNQQILNAANDIFENTWKQLQQLRTNEDAARRFPLQHVYRVNDNLGSTSNLNGNSVNALPGGNSGNAHLPILANQNVEIINPNIKPSPVDTSMVNPYEAFGHYPAAVLTTPIPIFSTTASFLVPRPIVASTTPAPINLQNYVDQLTHLGAQGNQVNKVEARPGFNSQDNQRGVYNPINFVPNVDLMKSQSMLNSKNTEPLPNQLNLVPLIPGGNFYKHSPGAQSELVQKPRLSNDLEKYAEEMFKESLRTIYNTHKWNSDRRFRGNYSAAELNELAKLKSELQRYKAASDSKYGPKDILEAHHSETNIRTADSSGRPTKKPELSMADIEQLFKSDFKLSLPPSGESSHRGSHPKNRPGHGSSRPSNEHSSDFGNTKLSDFLTPPKVNSFVSKSPFIDTPKPGKKRPGSHSPRFNSNSANSRHLPRASSLVSRSPSNHEASASHRVEKYRSYPTFTTPSAPDSDLFKPSSSERFSKTDYYDINHPRMHNLLGLLMKNKQLPKGSSQSIFRDEDELGQYFDDERRRIHTEFFNDNNMHMQKKLGAPINMMGPPAPPRFTQIRAYPTQIA
ncbi:GATA zinc finger domain-containing protein 14-like [Venturia canescens]|uniref:GATA zinc finger domain-containing protein 14-like n=1 Tax=Venturia canescens TaxID=32260 RepID=UPI001C9D0025|nr:GATA zinc finger domain-containing protein 14-like [Venturia canescens]